MTNRLKKALAASSIVATLGTAGIVSAAPPASAQSYNNGDITSDGMLVINAGSMRASLCSNNYQVILYDGYLYNCFTGQYFIGIN